MIKFGTDGWRAIIGKEFTFDNVDRVAQAYATLLPSPSSSPLNPIVLGFDRRFLSEEFAKAFAAVIAANGYRVLLSQGYCPTPCISWMTKSTQASGGVMITASHNPYSWNGIKFKEAYGGSASSIFTSRIEEQIQIHEKSGHLPLKIPFEEAMQKGLIQTFDPRKSYVEELRSFVDLVTLQKAPWKIVYDPMFGAGAGFLGKVLEMPIDEIHHEQNPAFGGLNPEPIEKNLFPLMNRVKKERFDVGLATDGDADRIGAVDEQGRFVNAHQIFALILNHLIERGERGDVIKTVSTTGMVDRIAARHRLKVHETPIGFKHICSKFLEVEPLIGGEESGGIGIPSHVYERDGLLSGLLLLEIMSVKKKRLGQLLQELHKEIGPFFFEREDLFITPEKREELIGRLSQNGVNQNGVKKIGPLKVIQINSLDGCKYLLEDGSWLLIRPSGTEPLVRLYAESSDLQRVRQILQEGQKIVFPQLVSR